MGSLDFGVANELALVEARIRESIVTEEPLLHDIARYVIESGGKRIRPMVTLLAFRALGGTDVRQAVDLAAAFELIHSATLIHDDINDGGGMGRGGLAADQKFGPPKWPRARGLPLLHGLRGGGRGQGAN